jgi:hypothetical protein
MGFRDPITSAAAVDTRTTPTTAGVRMYEAPNPDTGQPYGVVEWDDGLAGDVPARAVQTADRNPHSEVAPFGRLAISGGTYAVPSGTKAAPELDLVVESDGSGTGVTRSVARIVGADRVDLGLGWAFLRATAVQPASGTLAAGWQTISFGAADTDTDGGWSASTVGVKGPDRFVIQKTGEYSIEGTAAIGTVAAGTFVGARITINGAYRAGGVGDVQPIPAGSASPATGRKRYPLVAGDVVQLQGFASTAWSTRMTATSDGITSTLLIERTS